MRFSLNRSESGCFIPIYENVITLEDSVELVIPDVREDVGEILDVRGQVMLVSKKTMTDAASVTATVYVSALYLSESGDKIECVATEIPLEFYIAEAGLEEGNELLSELFLRSIEAKPLNPRKLLFRTKLTAKITAYSKGSFSVCSGLAEKAENIPIYYLKKQAEHCLVSALQEKTFAVSDEYAMAEDMDASELLFTQTSVCVDEVNSVGTKLVFKAKILTDAILSCGTEKAELQSVKFETEFSQIIETELYQNLTEALVYTDLISVDFVRRPAGTEASFAATFRIAATAVCMENVVLDYIEDAYSNSSPLILEQEQLELCKFMHAQSLKIIAEGSLSDNVNTMEISYLSAACITADSVGENISIEVLVRGVARGENDSLTPIELKLIGKDKIFLDPGQSIEILGVHWEELEISRDGSLSLELALTFLQNENTSVNAVCALAFDENFSAYSVSRPTLTVLCSKTSGNDLWTIAKKYGSTTEAIETTNTVDGLFSPEKRPLIIPKTR